jgi:hypothetical protein
MPAIQVARTDTFEQQRQKINQLGSTLFNITAGGSDLSTGNLKLGDGTRIAPSLAFVSDPGLGIYKPDEKTIGYVSDGKKVADFAPTGFYSFRDLILQQRVLSTSGISILNFGENYDAGTYTNIPVVGGSGDNAVSTINVTGFIGSITNFGENYKEGTYTNVFLNGGFGTGANVDFDVDGIDGNITSSGSGYIPGVYTGVPLINGSGTGAIATINISGTIILNGSITTPGSGYISATYNNVIIYNKPTTIYTVTSVANPNTPPPNNVYQINGVTQQILTLVKGNTYRFDTSDSSNDTHPFIFRDITNNILDGRYYIVQTNGTPGTAGSFVDIVIKPSAPTETIIYNCSAHPGMGANINITSGIQKYYGHNAQASMTVNESGVVSSFNVTNTGSDYKSGDILQIVLNSGSGFEYTLSTPTYNGIIDSVNVTDNGLNYDINDILSISNSSVGGYGSGFQYTIASDPGKVKNLDFNSKGSGYLVNDNLTLPSSITGVNTNLKGEILNLPTTLSSTSTTITVSSTVGIVAGMQVFNGAGDVGQLAQNTTVQSVTNLTDLVLSANPSISGSAALTFRSLGSFNQITVPSTSGIYQGYSVTKTSGSGVLSANTTVTSVNSLTNTITLSSNPTTAGSVVLSFIPPYGSPTQSFSYTISKLGVIDSFLISSGGNGYVVSDLITVSPQDLTQPISYAVTNKPVQKITFSSTLPSSTFSVGNLVKERDGLYVSGDVTTSTTIAGQANATYSNVSTTTSGSGSGLTLNIIRDSSGAISAVRIDGASINTSGYNYSVGDTVTISGSAIGGSSPTDNVIINITSVTESASVPIHQVGTSGSNISFILIGSAGITNGDTLVKTSNTSVPYTVNVASPVRYRYFINTGSGETLTPNITLYSGSTYLFDLTDPSNTGHVFALSKFRDGIWGPSLIENISTTLSTASSQITVSSTTGILTGMSVSVISGTGVLLANTVVQSIDSLTTLTLSIAPSVSGAAILSFTGVEYLEGVTRSQNSLKIKVTNNTPTLYYYCATNSPSHIDEGGEDNNEAVLSINNINPKTFGSGFQGSVLSVNQSNIITADIETGELTSTKFIGTSAQITNATISGTLTCPNISGTSLIVSTITSSTNISVNSNNFDLSGNLNIGNFIQILSSSGNITTSGVLKTTDSLNINDRINITNNTISSTAGNNILLSPATGRVAKINTTSAITIPSGTTAQRPAAGIVESGSIRFNTDTGQYEGYSGATTSWSSLGGVRDLDGNTYIAAEASVGANDNTLYFYNDGNNTLKITPTKFIFNVVKTIDSPNPLNPPSTEWAANTPVALNSYVFYGLNLYKVTTGGTTATSGNEPTHTTGTVANGTAQLEWYADYAGDVTFDKVKNVNINTNLVFNDELKLYDNKITTLLSDVVIEPFAGKKVDINTNTSLVLPNGTTGERGIPGQGSVRFNTSLSQFEGYNGVNWTSLGGVRDVDGNTYIIPETAPGANENILYFYNNGSNTLRLSTTELTFDTIDQIGSTSNNLDLQAQTVTFNSLALTVDNSGTSTKLLSTKTNIDLALSVGLYTNPLIRLNNTGDIYVNKGFGTATDTYIKVLDNELKTLEMDDTIISSSEYILTKGTTNSGASVIFDPTLHSGAKVILVANNTTTNHKDMIEFTVVAKDTDIFHTEYGNVVSGTDIIAPVFDFDAGGKVRLNVSLINGVTTGNVVNVTVVSTIIKK